METVLLFVLLTLALLIVGHAIYRVVRGARSFFQLRGKRLVTCPETHKTAAVAVDASRLACEATFGKLHLRLRECSRWPDRRDCGQDCVPQIAADPEGTRVSTIAAKWYAGKKCVCCGKLITEFDAWLDHKPALLNPEQAAFYWDAIPAEQLPEVLRSNGPLCWDCYIAATLRREHPELVTDRPARW
jgi:hypothetical protein